MRGEFIMFEALRSYTRGHRSPVVLVLPPLLLGLALLPGASPAAAQELPEVEVYHSPDDDGVPASETCRPGCRGCSPGTEGKVTIDFDGFDAGESVTGKIDEAYFYTTTPGREVRAEPPPGLEPVSSPHVVNVCEELEGPPYVDCSGGEIFINFSELAHNLSFWILADDAAAPQTLAQVNVFQSGFLKEDATVNIVGDGNPSTPHKVDLSNFGCISRIHIHNITDELGLAFDDFSFDMGGEYGCAIQGEEGDRINLWINGGDLDSDPLKTVCMKGEDGGDGHELCGADILLELKGFGTLSNFNGDEAMTTLVHNPPCDEVDEGGDCVALPAGKTQLRMNFRRGEEAPIADKRRVGWLEVEVDGVNASPANPVSVEVSGIAAVGANLQMRLIPKDHVIAKGPGARDCIPEPGETMLLVSGLAGLALLYRLRGRP
jgi:hypothetical protein